MSDWHNSGRIRTTLLLASILAVSTLSHPAYSQLVNGRLISSVTSWERFDTVNVSNTLTRGFQSLFLDVAQSDFSIHTHLQGAVALQEKLDETPDFRAFYLYAKWRNIGDALDLSMGRVPYFAGVGNGTLDGVVTSARFAGNAYRVTLYGGGLVPVDLGLSGWKPLSKSFAAGAQFITSAIPNTRLGLSYVNRQRSRDAYQAIRTDSLFNPFSTVITPEKWKEQFASADLSYRAGEYTFYGRYDHNLNDQAVQRGQFGVRGTIDEVWSASAEFIHREPRIPSGSFFSVFSYSAVNEVEAGLDYRATPAIRTFLRGAYVLYDGENSFRYTLGAAHNYVSLSISGNTGYAGELGSATLQGVYPLFERTLIPSAAVTYSSYALNSAVPRETALAGAIGVTIRPMQTLSLDGQVQWVENKIVKNDFRFFGKVQFWFSEQFHIFD